MIRKTLTAESLRNLGRLQGEFRLPERQVKRDQVLGIFVAVIGAGLSWFVLRRYQESAVSVRMITRAVYGVVALIIGIRFWLSAGRWYRFGSGQVQSLSRSGEVRWEESVPGIVSGTISYDHKISFMTLRWARIRGISRSAGNVRRRGTNEKSAMTPVDLPCS